MTKGKSTLVIPDFEVNSELEAAQTLAQTMGTARTVIENLAKEYEDNGKEIPKPGSVSYKKEKGYTMTCVDVNLDRLMRKAKLEELERLEEDRVHSMWDVKENVIEFLLNQKGNGSYTDTEKTCKSSKGICGKISRGSPYCKRK